MYKPNRAQQGSIFDRTANMTTRERGVLENSWAEDFSRNIFPRINEDRFSVLFDDRTGRPNTPINVMVGALIIKEMFEYTDDEMYENMLLNQQVQHALNLTSAEEIPFSDRTLSRFRRALLGHEADTGEDLLKEEIIALALHIKDLLGIGDRIRRMDSLMISSRCKKIGRLELVYSCIEDLAKECAKLNGLGFLPESLVKYTVAGNKNATIYRMKGGEAETRLDAAVADAIAIRELCREGFGGCTAYLLLERMLGDQTTDGKPKPGKEIKPTSLQNPSDPDATFRRKAGSKHTGYVGNVVEGCENGECVIIDYGLEQNVHSDQEFGKKHIENTEPQPEGAVLVCDGAYGSEENFDAAEARGILLVPTCLAGKAPNPSLVDFEIDGDAIARCPCGAVPVSSGYNEDTRTLSASFEACQCEPCGLRGTCPSAIRKGRGEVKFTDTAYNRSLHARNLGSEEYKEYGKIRNGVEAVPSVLRRKLGVDSIPVSGLKPSAIFFGCKVAAMNVATLVRSRLKKQRATGLVCPEPAI
jgi:hypothetical protein